MNRIAPLIALVIATALVAVLVTPQGFEAQLVWAAAIAAGYVWLNRRGSADRTSGSR
jgi:hypothetical protein